MKLSVRPNVYLMPSYSLTSDLLSFRRCPLRYRFHELGKHPATKPVVMWFGQFIHGVMEEGFRKYKSEGVLPPWPKETMDELCKSVERRLEANNMFAWNRIVRELGYLRAYAALNDLCPHLFPLIFQPEVRVVGSREFPFNLIPKEMPRRKEDFYEIIGVIDVITKIAKEVTLSTNPLYQFIRQSVAGDLDESEVIVDYKGMRRPAFSQEPGGMSYWDMYEWQLQTYSFLRGKQPDANKIAGGVLVFLNELSPSSDDIDRLQDEIANNRTDIIPPERSKDKLKIMAWKRGRAVPQLSPEFRLRRALRFIAVSEASIEASLKRFDEVVAKMEYCRISESCSGQILESWQANAEDKFTCAACNAKTFCPSYSGKYFPKLPMTSEEES